MPLLEKACCCMELATGAAVLGWLAAIGSAINVILAIVQLTNPEIGAGVPIISIITYLIYLCVAIMLIRGAMNRNRRLVLPYLVVSLIVLIIMNLIYIIAAFSSGQYGLIGSIIIGDLISGYFWACVYSFYQELEMNSGGTV